MAGRHPKRAAEHIPECEPLVQFEELAVGWEGRIFNGRAHVDALPVEHVSVLEHVATLAERFEGVEANAARLRRNEPGPEQFVQGRCCTTLTLCFSTSKREPGLRQYTTMTEVPV